MVMRTIASLAAFGVLLSVTAVSPPSAEARVGSGSVSEVAGALRTAEVAEIYIVSPGVSTRTNLRAYHVRSLGCLYRVEGLQGNAGFRRGLAAVAVPMTPGRSIDAGADLRVGLVLGDRRGTLLEIYVGDGPSRDGMAPGFMGRRPVRLSAAFATALRQYAEAHPELMIVNPRAPHLCPSRARP